MPSKNFAAFKQKHPCINNLQGTATTPTEAYRATTGTANAGWRFGRDGQVDRRQGTYSNNHHRWEANNLVEARTRRYEIRATKQSGTDPNVGSALSTWLRFQNAATFNWEFSNSTNGTTMVCVLKIEIRAVDCAASKNDVMVGYYKITAKDTGGGTTTTTTSPPTTVPPTTSPTTA